MQCHVVVKNWYVIYFFINFTQYHFNHHNYWAECVVYQKVFLVTYSTGHASPIEGMSTLLKIWGSLQNIDSDLVSLRVHYLKDNTSTPIHAGAWKRKPRRVIISSKNQNKDYIHKMQKMIILLKWMDFRYYFLLCSTRRGELGYHVILKSKLNQEMILKCSFKLMLKNA